MVNDDNDDDDNATAPPIPVAAGVNRDGTVRIDALQHDDDDRPLEHAVVLVDDDDDEDNEMPPPTRISADTRSIIIMILALLVSGSNNDLVRSRSASKNSVVSQQRASRKKKNNVLTKGTSFTTLNDVRGERVLDFVFPQFHGFQFQTYAPAVNVSDSHWRVCIENLFERLRVVPSYAPAFSSVNDGRLYDEGRRDVPTLSMLLLLPTHHLFATNLLKAYQKSRGYEKKPLMAALQKNNSIISISTWRINLNPAEKAARSLIENTTHYESKSYLETCPLCLLLALQHSTGMPILTKSGIWYKAFTKMACSKGASAIFTIL